MRFRAGALCAILGVAMVVASLAAWWSDAAAARHVRRSNAAAPAPTITVGSPLPVQPIRSGFLGLSFEYWALEHYAGTNPNAVDPILEQLITNLTQGAPTVIRIGGISTDRTWWPVPGVPRSPAGYYTLTTRRLQVAQSLAQNTNAKLILGVNFEADSFREAQAESQAMMRVVGSRWIDGLELGNEPELYGNRWFYQRDGTDVFARPPTWDFQSFLPDYLHMVSALGRAPLAGPGIGALTWMQYLNDFLNTKRVSVVTLHRYPLQSCGPTPGQPKYPSIPHLLSATSSRGLADVFQPYVEIAHAHGEQVRNAEMNSVSCGLAGAWGSANTFAGALWALDTMFAMASVGVDGVNIHTYAGAPDELFSISHVHGRWRAYVAPEYYGVLMFSEAAPPGSRLLQISGVSGTGTVRAWATRTPDGEVNVVLINDATGHPQDLTVQVPGSMPEGTLERLSAPRVQATSGVTIGGQSFGRETTTGLPAGAFRFQLLPRARTLHIFLPAASAAMLTFG